MAQPLPRSEWYDQSLPEKSAPANSPKRKKRTGLKVTAIVLSVLILMASSVYIFSDRLTRRIFFQVPDGGSSESAGDGSGKSDDDFRSYLEQYYSAVQDEALAPSNLAKAEEIPDCRLEFVSAVGREELSYREVYEKCAPSIVGLRGRYENKRYFAWGTGIVLSEDGCILTNQHIISELVGATVILDDGSEYEAFLVGEDPRTDLAVLKIDATGLVPAEFGDSADLSVGDRVVAIGNPHSESLSKTMTNGIISGVDREVSYNGRHMYMLQTNAAINEGSSGGALVNMYGQVVGVTNMKIVNYSSGVPIEGLCFAVPSATARAVTDQLIPNGAVTGRPGLGITVGEIPEDAGEEYELPEGLYVLAVSEGSDAKDKGITPGDIIMEANGRPVVSTQDLLEVRDALVVGDRVTLKLWRDGEILEITIVVGDLNNFY